MKSSKMKLFLIISSILLCILCVFLAFYLSSYFKIYNEIDQLEEEITTVPKDDDYSLFLEKNVVGILEIPIIHFKSNIKEGTELENLKNCVGHFKETSLHEGNIGIAGHNRRLHD